MLGLFQWRAAFGIRQRNRECRGNTGKRGVNAGLINKQPHHQAHQRIRCNRHDFCTIKSHKNEDAQASAHQSGKGQLVGIKKRDDQNRAQVINDGHSRQKHFQRRRYPAAQQYQNTESKSDVGRCGYGPAAQCNRAAPVDGRVDQCGHQHAAQRRTGWQHGLAA